MRTFSSSTRSRSFLGHVTLVLSLAPFVLLADPPTTFSEWLTSNSISAGSDDPTDRNGPLNLTNLEAYAYGVNPFTAVGADLPKLIEANSVDGLRVFYRRNTAAIDLSLIIEGSDDMANWDEVTPSSEDVIWTVDGVDGREALLPWVGPDEQFVRLFAELVPVDTSFVDIAAGTMPAFVDYGFDEITITQAYKMSKYEVTLIEWQTVVAWAVANGYPNLGSYGATACADDHPVGFLNWYHAVIWCNARSEMEGLDPVYYDTSASPSVVYRGPPYGAWVTSTSFGSEVISWDMTKDGYRLPTAAEWEYAARGGEFTNNYIYSGGDDLNAVATHAQNSINDEGSACDLQVSEFDPRGTWPVGSRAANELGLYDMTGNVYEMLWDPNFSTNTGDAEDPGEKLRGRRAIGASWLFGDYTVNAITSYQPIQTGNWLGFRVARNQ